MNSLKKIILVDDEPLILKSLKRELEPWAKNSNIEIITFLSAPETLDYLKDNYSLVFLVISDLRMPKMKGSELLKEINKLYPEIKLFLLTAYSDITDIQTAVNASIDKLLLKPWEYKGLESDIETALKMYEIEKKNILLKKEIEENLTTAAEFQRQLLTNSVVDKNSVDIEIHYSPLEELKCGGDFYDIIELDSGNKLILMGDVSGHGIKPAFVTAMLKVLCSMLKPTLFKKDVSPSEVISTINKGLFSSLGEIKDILVSFTVIYIDSMNKKIKVSGAGQRPIYILSNDTIKSLSETNVVMGFMHDSEYTEVSEDLIENDLIIMFTDGLIQSKKSKSVMDNSRIQQLLLTLKLEKEPSTKIFNSFKELQDNKKFADDVTLITARIL